MTKLAVVRVRGAMMKTKVVEDTLDMLKLHKRFFCSIVEDTPSRLGQLKKVQGFVTWGEVDSETEKELSKNGEKRFYRLHPPRGGFERKGTKAPYAKGGALGNRGKEINTLIRRMLP